MVEQWIPNPRVVGSSPSWPATNFPSLFFPNAPRGLASAAEYGGRHPWLLGRRKKKGREIRGGAGGEAREVATAGEWVRRPGHDGPDARAKRAPKG